MVTRTSSPNSAGLPASQSDDQVTETTRLLGGTHLEATARGGNGEWDGSADFEGLPWWRRPSVFWLLLPYSIFTLAFGSVMVPKVNLIKDLVCQRYFANQGLRNPGQSYRPVVLGQENPQCGGSDVQKLVAAFMLVMNLCTGVLSAFAAPRIGHLSDRLGRSRLLALVSCGGLLGELITILAAKFPQAIDYRWLVLGSVFDGISGSFTAGNILTQSYTSDCTPPSKRAVAIGYIYACLFTGLALGQFLGGEIVKLTGSLVSIFYVCLGAHVLFVFLVGFIIPESLSEKRKFAAQEKHRKEKQQREEQPSSWVSSIREKNPFAALAVLWPTERGTTTRLRINLVALAICDMIIMGSAIAAGQIIILYAGYVFGWKTPESSSFVALVSMVRVVVLMGIFPIINYLFRTRPAARLRKSSGITPVDKNGGADNLDLWILRFALVSDVLGYIGYALARSPGLFVASAVVTAFGGLGSATSQSVVTKHVPQDRVGKVLGAIGMLQALVRVIGPVVLNGLYAATVETYPQAIFACLGGLFVVALLCSFLVTPFVHWEAHVEEGEEEGEEEDDEQQQQQQQPLLTTQHPDPFGTNVSRLPLDEDVIRY